MKELLQIAEVQLTYKNKRKGTVNITQSQNAYNVFKSIWADDIELRERFYVMFLNRRNNIIAVQEISAGSTTGCVVDAKFIFATAVKVMAEGIILSHNHPSGNTKPSEPDIQITKKIKEICKLFDMSLLDHLILTDETYLSMADEGLM